MFKKLIIRYGKKYAVNQINELLSEYKDNVAKISDIINIWIERLEKITFALKKINLRVADGKIEDDEINDSLDEIRDIVDKW